MGDVGLERVGSPDTRGRGRTRLQALYRWPLAGAHEKGWGRGKATETLLVVQVEPKPN